MSRLTDPILDDTVYFRSDRVFYQGSSKDSESGWYISMRGGYAYGPFPERNVALTILDGLIKRLRAKEVEEAGKNLRQA